MLRLPENIGFFMQNSHAKKMLLLSASFGRVHYRVPLRLGCVHFNLEMTLNGKPVQLC